jgi:hypothetical protein
VEPSTYKMCVQVDTAVKRGQFEESIEFCNQALVLTCKNNLLLANLKQAERDCSTALKLCPEGYKARICKVNVYLATGQLSLAEQDLLALSQVKDMSSSSLTEVAD